MASKYDRFKYIYTNDLGRNRIKLQQARYVENGYNNKIYTTPITSLFMARVVNNSYKLNGTSRETRRLIAFVSFEGKILERTCHLPYPPNDTILLLHIKEILAADNVVCGDYYGENPLELDTPKN